MGLVYPAQGTALAMSQVWLSVPVSVATTELQLGKKICLVDVSADINNRIV